MNNYNKNMNKQYNNCKMNKTNKSNKNKKITKMIKNG